MSIESRFKELVLDHMAGALEPEDVTRDADFINDLQCDSLDTVELVIAAETTFALEIPDEDWERIRTVGQACDYLKTRVKAEGHHG